MTHVLSISSAQLPKPDLPLFNHCFIDIPNNGREALLLELPTACKFIGDAITNGGQVLVQCRVELRACIVVCAYCKWFLSPPLIYFLHGCQPVMFTRHVTPRQALGLLESGKFQTLNTYQAYVFTRVLFQRFHCIIPQTTSTVI